MTLALHEHQPLFHRYLWFGLNPWKYWTEGPPLRYLIHPHFLPLITTYRKNKVIRYRVYSIYNTNTLLTTIHTIYTILLYTIHYIILLYFTTLLYIILTTIYYLYYYLYITTYIYYYYILLFTAIYILLLYYYITYYLLNLLYLIQ